MKVWAVFRHNVEEDLVAIFSSEEKAKAFCEEKEKSRKFTWESIYWYEEWKVE